MRDGLLFLHILSAATWIGGGIFGTWAFGRIANTEGGGPALRAVAEKAGSYFGPSAGLTLLTGIVLVLTGDAWNWGDGFVIIGLSAFAFSAAFQPLVASKTEERLLDAADKGEDMRPAVGAFSRASLIEMAVLLFALYAMIAKFGA